MIETGLGTPARQRAYDEANRRWYENTDWALDIREAEFSDLDIRGIPSRLLRRDPESQVVVSRAAALEGKWRQLDLSGTHWPTALEFFLEQGHGDVVLVAGKRDKRFARLLDGLRLLQLAGLARGD